ncbi:hypothetical protein KEU06_11210 [Pseudaminobacter sp. 19-2017]|uniref:Cell division protein FtsL n=1 Tax=Pseudaminobacter soli (ex Zhang et al. 2022) TaxID=2831468 RepID=A0A942I9C0_9HYPH|nr:hypothetical protein [Pseudaminobacter soli]MBS3649176.1 hypothetical protein [Pseudaminobacter soli]
MFRTSDMVLIAVMVAAAAFTYKVKQEAEDQLAAVRKLESQIRLEEDSIVLLKADWSLLTQPARLQKLTEKYQTDLNLQPTDAHQFARIDEIPVRPLDIKEIIGNSLDLLAEGVAVDETTTGAVHE